MAVPWGATVRNATTTKEFVECLEHGMLQSQPMPPPKALSFLSPPRPPCHRGVLQGPRPRPPPRSHAASTAAARAR